MSRLSELRKIGWPSVDTPDITPVAIVDCKVVTFKEGMRPVEGKSASLYKVNDKTFPLVCDVLKVEYLRVKGLLVTDLAPIAKMSQLRGLYVYWANKLTDITPLQTLKKLDGLVLSDFSKLTDISPLRVMTQLKALERSGGMGAKDTIETLDPITELPNLHELCVNNVRVLDGGILPLSRCKALKQLDLSNQFPTEEYAYLSVMLSETKCDHFQPYIRLSRSIDDKDVMIVGSRKPFLNFVQDQERITKYERRFQELQKKFAEEV